MDFATTVTNKQAVKYINTQDASLSTTLTAAYTAADLKLVSETSSVAQAGGKWTIPDGTTGMVTLTAAASAGELVMPAYQAGAVLFVLNADDADTTSTAIVAGETAMFIGIAGGWTEMVQTT